MSDRPLISFIVVARDAEGCLPLLLADLEAQTFPHDKIEVLLVDSASVDGTYDVMEAFREGASFAVRLLRNPKKYLAAGCNVAFAAARGEALIRVDAHARIPLDFLQKNYDALQRGEKIVGGSVQSPRPGYSWEAVLFALDASRFCGGAAPFRNLGAPRYVDTLAYALYDRSVFETVGLYDEQLRRTEDNEMHYRMKQAGFRFYFSPDIVSTHAPRDTLSGQLRQKWGNGYWIGRTMHLQPRCFAPRHFVPALFVTVLVLCLLILPITSAPLLALLAVYGAADLFFSVQASATSPVGKALCLLCLPFLFPLVHISYGLGTIVGLLTPGGKR